MQWMEWLECIKWNFANDFIQPTLNQTKHIWSKVFLGPVKDLAHKKYASSESSLFMLINKLCWYYNQHSSPNVSAIYDLQPKSVIKITTITMMATIFMKHPLYLHIHSVIISSDNNYLLRGVSKKRKGEEVIIILFTDYNFN